jgi:prevent-host-death family protein
MRSVSVREMRTALPRLEQLLAEEGEIVITRNGKPVARVLPTRTARSIPAVCHA